jgi:hypothetical protein
MLTGLCLAFAGAPGSCNQATMGWFVAGPKRFVGIVKLE